MKSLSLLTVAAAIVSCFFLTATALAVQNEEKTLAEDSRPYMQYYKKMVSERQKNGVNEGALHIAVIRRDRPNLNLDGVMLVQADMSNKLSGSVQRYQFGDEQRSGDIGHSDTVYIEVMPTQLMRGKDTYLVKVDYAERRPGEKSFNSSSFLINKGEMISIQAGLFDENTATTNATLTFKLE